MRTKKAIDGVLPTMSDRKAKASLFFHTITHSSSLSLLSLLTPFVIPIDGRSELHGFVVATARQNPPSPPPSLAIHAHR